MQRCDLAARFAAEGLRDLPWDRWQRLLFPFPLPPHAGQEVPLPRLQGKDISIQTASEPSRAHTQPKYNSLLLQSQLCGFFCRALSLAAVCLGRTICTMGLRGGNAFRSPMTC